MDRIFNEKDLKNIMKTKFEIGQQVSWVMVGKIYNAEVVSSFVQIEKSKEGQTYKKYYKVKCTDRYGFEFFETFDEDYLFGSEKQAKDFLESRLNHEPNV